MGLIRYRKFNIPHKVNPFLALGLKKDASISETKSQFRAKLQETRYDDEKRAIICLSYDIIVNKSYYIECEKDNYKIKVEGSNKMAYYYCVIGDFVNLVNQIEKNPKILFFKDALERSLLYIAARNGHTSICEYLINKGLDVNSIQSTKSTPLHGASYYGQINVVKLLLNYGAKTNIKNQSDHLPIDEAMTEEIKNVLKESENDPVVKLYQSLKSKDITNKLIPISYKNNIIGKKIICRLKNLPKQYKLSDIKNKWESAWHGTNFTCLESIAEIGLKPAGGKTSNGKDIEVCANHLSQTATYDDVPDWGNAIFISPSIFYSANPSYAKDISCKNELYKVLVEVKVKPGCYKKHGSTCSSYVLKINEPKMLEYRVEPDNVENVQVVSLTFVKSEFFLNVKKYEEGNFLTLNKNEIIK